MKYFISGIKLPNCFEKNPFHHYFFVKRRIGLKKLFDSNFSFRVPTESFKMKEKKFKKDIQIPLKFCLLIGKIDKFCRGSKYRVLLQAKLENICFALQDNIYTENVTNIQSDKKNPPCLYQNVPK